MFSVVAVCVCVCTGSSQGVFSLKNTYFEPRYILLIPTDQEQYAHRLRTRALYTPSQIDSAVARIGLYARINRERPGFFDNVIRCGTYSLLDVPIQQPL